MYPGNNVSGRESGLYIWPRKPVQPICHCLVGDLTPEYLKGLILGTPQVGKGARNLGENQDYIYVHESHSNLLTIASWGVDSHVS